MAAFILAGMTFGRLQQNDSACFDARNFVRCAIWSRVVKFGGNLTHWRCQDPVSDRFAAIMAVLYKNLARTYWAFRERGRIPLVFRGAAFLPFLAERFWAADGFYSVYATLYLIAVRRFSQRSCWSECHARSFHLSVGALPLHTERYVIPTLEQRSRLSSGSHPTAFYCAHGFDPRSPKPPVESDYDDYPRIGRKDLPNSNVDRGPRSAADLKGCLVRYLAFQPSSDVRLHQVEQRPRARLGIRNYTVADKIMVRRMAEELGLLGDCC